MNDICRTCLSTNGKKITIFSKISNNSFVTLDAMLLEVASVQVIKDDGYSSLMCEICIQNLNNAFLFRQKCRKADQFIRQCNSNKLTYNIDNFLKSNCAVDEIEQINSLIKLENNSDVYLNEIERNLIHDSTNIKSSDATDTEEPELCSKLIINEKVIVKDQKNNLKTKKISNINSVIKKKNKVKNIFFDELTPNQNEKHENNLIKENHMFAVNEKGEKEFHCFICKIIYKKRSEFIEHTRTHNMKAPFICRKCGKCHSNSTALKMHYNHHTTGQPYCCEICGKRYFRSGDLKVHMRNHTGEKPFKCSQCDKSFRRPHILAKHFQTHSGIKLYTCKICGKKLTNLDYHMRMHRNDRRFECHMCGKTFIKKSHLTTHMVVHTGDKKHVCTICGKAFGWISNLHQHSLIHSGKQSHVCEVCGQSFMHKHAMQTHMKKHDSIE